VVSAAKKPIFGYLGMVYGAPLRLFFPLRVLVKYVWICSFQKKSQVFSGG